MKKTIIAVGMLFAMTMSATIHAQESGKKENEEGFVFTTVKENPITSIKNQNRAGTCWCYSTMAFLESELLRMGKGEYDLSEMFTVYNTIWIVRMQLCVLTGTFPFHKAVLSMT